MRWHIQCAANRGYRENRDDVFQSNMNLIDGGIMAGHDWMHPPIVQATSDFFGPLGLKVGNWSMGTSGSTWKLINGG